MDTEDIISFLHKNIQPLYDSMEGNGYRVAAYLKDGTYLPCVRFLNPAKRVELAMKRFAEEQQESSLDNQAGYEDMVETFVTKGNLLNEYDIDRIEISPYAIPIEILVQIRGETTMSWTGFCLKMKDGKVFGFGSQFLFQFFQMPEGYAGTDIVEVINHSYINTSGEVKTHSVPFFNWPKDYDEKAVHRERPYFDCYVKGL